MLVVNESWRILFQVAIIFVHDFYYSNNQVTETTKHLYPLKLSVTHVIIAYTTIVFCRRVSLQILQPGGHWGSYRGDQIRTGYKPI